MNNNTNNEIWKAVVREGFEGCYEVSNLGRVRSVDRVVKSARGDLRYKGRLLTPSPNNDGYLTINLCYAGKKNNVKVHRLVAEAFLQNRKQLPEVNHIDEIKTNNEVSNLEWCTRIENMNHGTATKRMREHENQLARLRDSMSPVVGISTKDARVIEFESISQADRNGFPRRNIWSALNGNDATCRGYVWLYKKDYTPDKVNEKLNRIKDKQVAHLDDDGEIIEVLGSVKQASEIIGVHSSNVTRACNHGRKTKGYRLKYI